MAFSTRKGSHRGGVVSWGLPALSLLAIVTIGASRLFDPFSGDQALFLVGAKALHAGGTLYRDYWDIKQPAIFAFFLIGGVVFGFTQIGVHALDLVWQTGFAVALVIWSRGVLRDPRWAAFTPLAVVGSTYAGSSHWHLLQVEELVGLPLFACMWAAGRATRRRTVSARFALVSGAAAGLVVLFKLLLLPIAVAVALAIAFRTCRVGFPERRRFWMLWVVGTSAPIAVYALYALATGSGRIALETTFVVPFQIAGYAAHAPISRLDDSVMRLLLYFRGLIVLAAIGAFAARGASVRPWRDACLAWIAAGLAVILVQADSWWQYHFELLVPPLGILATFGAAFLAERVSRGRFGGLVALAASGVVAYIAVPLPQGAIGTILRVARERPYASPSALERYRIASSSEYAEVSTDAAQSPRDGGTSQPIYVFGNPLVYVLANRTPAAPMTSWSSYLDPPELWARVDDELAAGRPRYIFVFRERSDDVSLARAPKMSAALTHDYVVAAQTADGIWYRKRGPS